MSRAFIDYFRLFRMFRSLGELEMIAAPVLGTFCLASHGIYTLSTTEKKVIEIESKYQFDTNGFTNFMIVTKDGSHMRVNNSFWYWKFNSIEDWYKIKVTDKIEVKKYGYRIPILRIFPNIVGIGSYPSRPADKDEPKTIVNTSVYAVMNIIP